MRKVVINSPGNITEIIGKPFSLKINKAPKLYNELRGFLLWRDLQVGSPLHLCQQAGAAEDGQRCQGKQADGKAKKGRPANIELTPEEKYQRDDAQQDIQDQVYQIVGKAVSCYPANQYHSQKGAGTQQGNDVIYRPAVMPGEMVPPKSSQGKDDGLPNNAFGNVPPFDDGKAKADP